MAKIRSGEFSPDSTRSGRFFSAVQVEKRQGLETVKAENPSDAIRISDSSDSDGMGTRSRNYSSSESGDECVVAPRRLRNVIAVPKGANLWQHQRLKTLHLMKEDERRSCQFLLVRPKTIRVVVDANQRFDIPQCRQCFRSKAILD